MAADGANGTSGVAATAPGPIIRDILITRAIIIMAAPMAPMDITAAMVVVVAVGEVAARLIRALIGTGRINEPVRAGRFQASSSKAARSAPAALKRRT